MPSQNHFDESQSEQNQGYASTAGSGGINGINGTLPSSMAQVAAQERVSAAELASALAAIETRRMRPEQSNAQTITVGEAIEQLDLDIAPSEVLSEILAQREQKADEMAARTKRRQRFIATLLPFSFFLFLIGLVFFVAGRETRMTKAPVQTTTVINTPPANRFLPPAIQTDPSTMMDQNGLQPKTLRVRDKGTSSSGVVIRTLAEIKDNHPVMVTYNDLITQVRFDVRPGAQGASSAAEWTIIKHKGVAYLRGYLGSPMSPAALASGEVVVFNRPVSPAGSPVGPNPSPITLRLDTLQAVTDSEYKVGSASGDKTDPFDDANHSNATYSFSDGNWQRLILPPGVHGDSHLWEHE